MLIQRTVVIRKERRQYSSWCPELDVASAGDSIEEARANLEEAVNEMLATLSELGELDQFLAERGIIR